MTSRNNRHRRRDARRCMAYLRSTLAAPNASRASLVMMAIAEANAIEERLAKPPDEAFDASVRGLGMSALTSLYQSMMWTRPAHLRNVARWLGYVR